MPIKRAKLALLAKAETTYGVDSIPTGALNAMLVATNVEISPLEGDEAEIGNVRPYMGHSGTIRGSSYRKLKFETSFAGSGTAGTQPGWAVLVRGCSCSLTVVPATSVTVAPITDGQDSITFYCNIDGINYVMTGSRGTFKVDIAAKAKPKIMWEFTGLFTPVVDAALPIATYTGWAKPVALNKANTTASLHGLAVAMQQLSFDAGVDVKKRDLTMVDSVEVMDRKASATMVFENTTVAARNWVGLAQAKSLGSMVVAHGTTAGNICTLNATNSAELGNLTYSESDQVQMVNMPIRFQPIVGNDEWSLVLT